jgi:UPF0716 protein FxsA
MSPAAVLWLLFLLLPLAEIAIFIVVGRAIGVGATLALVLASAILGTILARREGLATARAAFTSLDRGEVPIAEVISGAVLLVAAMLIAFPGFASDIVGFALLFRPLRLKLGAMVLKALIASRMRHEGEAPPTITVEAERIDPDNSA